MSSSPRPIVPLILMVSLIGTAASAADRFSWSKFERMPDDWYRSPEGRKAVENVLTHQANLGDWPKNLDTSAEPFRGDRARLKGTFDNGATSGETRFLARAYRLTTDVRCRSAVEKSVDHVLKAQYPTGGWPQLNPPGPGYHRHITFNDDTMLRLLELCRDIGRSDEFRFLDQPRKDAANRAFDAGIRCVLACQIKDNGELTVWCAQHDEVSLEPSKGRMFEPVSLSGSESAGILMLLMSLENPSPEVVRAVEAGVHWFDQSKLAGIKLDRDSGDLKVVKDAGAAPLWARFVEIGTGRPIFSSRDGVIRYDVAEIDAERRNGYAWYGAWGKKVADRHARWSRDRVGQRP